MPTLRSMTAKLALDNPELRGDLVPLLKQAKEEGELVLHLATRGAKYEIAVYYDQDSDKFNARYLTNGRRTGASNSFNHFQMVNHIGAMVADAKEIDNITYKVVRQNRDLFGIRLASILGPPGDEAIDDKLNRMTMLPNNEQHPNWIFAHGGGLAGWISKDDLRKSARRGDVVYFLGAPGGNAKILGWITPQRAKKLTRSLRLAADETDSESRFEKNKSVPLSALPGDLQQNAKNPPPKVKKVKEEMQGKKSSLDRRTLDQLVEMDADSSEFPNASRAKATPETVRAADKFTRAVSQNLAIWAQKYPPQDGSTVSDLMRANAAYLVYMTLEGHGVGIWDGRWDRFYKYTKKLENFLARALSREHDALQTAISNAAWETAGGEQ